jgi:hypothetical protein
MPKRFMMIIRCLWVFPLVIAGTTVGAVHGWETSGLVGLIVLGLIGFAAGAFHAITPLLLLQILA